MDMQKIRSFKGVGYSTGDLEDVHPSYRISSLLRRCFSQSGRDQSPTLRTFYDNTMAITALAFHPFEPYVVSGSADCSIKFFNVRSSVKRAQKHMMGRWFHLVIFMREKIPVPLSQIRLKYALSRSIQAVISSSVERNIPQCASMTSAHGAALYRTTGTGITRVRVRHTTVGGAYVERATSLAGAVTSTAYAREGNIYVSGSEDGAIKIWDGVNNRCVNTIASAHGGVPVRCENERMRGLHPHAAGCR